MIQRIGIGRWLALLSCVGSFALVTAQQLSNDPGSYFGGSDHEKYLSWITDNQIDIRYNASAFLPAADPGQGAAIHWAVQGDQLHLAIAARASGWLAFGISQAGGMLGSDIAYFETAEPERLTDAHVIEIRNPAPDDCSQDWTLVAADVSREGFLMWQGHRPLVTDDTQDYTIVSDADLVIPPHRVIAAWGDTDRIAYHGRSNVARGAVRFFVTAGEEVDFAAEMSTQSTGSFFVSATNHPLALQETDYVDFCFSKADLLAQGLPDQALHVVAFEPIVTPETEKYVHHFVVSATPNVAADVCDQDEFLELAYVWAPGEGRLVLPDNLGAPLFGTAGFAAFSIEIHYNNPDRDAGMIDSSGVRFFYTDQLREADIGILQLGDPDVALFGQPVGNGLSRHTLDCPASCSETVLDEPVTVLREYLHMHKTGVRMVNEHFRDGQKIREGSIEVWEFDQQGNAAVLQEPFQIAPGDSFRTSCYYRDLGTGRFGLGSQEEMCIVFLFYYPRQPVFNQVPWYCAYDTFWPPCDASYQGDLLASDEEMDRRFGQIPSLLENCGDTDGTGSPMGTSPSAPSVPTATVAPSAALDGIGHGLVVTGVIVIVANFLVI